MSWPGSGFLHFESWVELPARPAHPARAYDLVLAGSGLPGIMIDAHFARRARPRRRQVES